MVNYANSDPAVVRSGKVKKTVANAVQQEASQVLGVESLSGAGGPCDIINCSGETDAQEESIHERTISRKKKKKRHKRRPGWDWRRRVSHGYLATAGLLYLS